MQNIDEVQNVFARSWTLLSKNWIIIVPGIVIGIAAGILSIAFVGAGAVTGGAMTALGSPGAGVMSALMFAMIAGLIGALATILTITVTTGMAQAAWLRGTATIADGAAAFTRNGAQAAVAVVLLFVIGAVAVFLLPFTLGLSILAFWVFFIYTMPGVIVGGLPAAEAIATSLNLAAKNFVPTLIIVVLFGIIAAIAAWVGAIFHLGSLFSAVVGQVFLAYAMLVIVGEYLRLRTPAGVTVAPPPPVPPPAAPTA